MEVAPLKKDAVLGRNIADVLLLRDEHRSAGRFAEGEVEGRGSERKMLRALAGWNSSGPPNRAAVAILATRGGCRLFPRLAPKRTDRFLPGRADRCRGSERQEAVHRLSTEAVSKP